MRSKRISSIYFLYLCLKRHLISKGLNPLPQPCYQQDAATNEILLFPWRKDMEKSTDYGQQSTDFFELITKTFELFLGQQTTDNSQQTLGIHCLNSVTEASRSFASLREYSVVPSAPPAWELPSLTGLLNWKLKIENGKLIFSFQLSIFNSSRCVRDWSGILLER